MSPIAHRPSPIAHRPSPIAHRPVIVVAGLFVVLRASWAISPPIVDPDALGYGSTWGAHGVGDAPPPSCWPAGTQPRLLGPLYRGSTALHVARADPSSSMTAVSNAQAGVMWAPITEPDVLPFTTGASDTRLWAVQGSASSELRVEVPPVSSEVVTPVLTQVPDAGAVAVEVRRVFPGAVVTASVPGRASQSAWDADGDVVSVRLPPGTTVGETITITAEVAGVVRSITTTMTATSRPVTVAEVPWLAEAGAYHVTVSGVTPGSEVRVEDATGAVLGSAWFGGSYGVVPVCGLTSTFRLRVLRGNGATLSNLTSALPDPTVIAGPSTPALAQIGGHEVVEYPAAGSVVAVAVVCNGQGQGFQDLPPYADGLDDGYRGFDWLGVYLARRRVHTFSVNCDYPRSPQARALIVADVLQALPVARPSLGELPKVLIGHSFGGEGVVLAARARLVGGDTLIRGVVAIAPSTDVGGVGPDAFPLLVLNGDEDSTTAGTFQPIRAPLRYIDARTGAATALHLHQAGHWTWNEATPFPGELARLGDDAAIREAARRYVLRFVRGVTASTSPGVKTRASLWDGSAPRATWSYRVRPWFKEGEVLMVDDFEDGVAGLNALGSVALSPSGSLVEGVKSSLVPHALHDGAVGLGVVSTAGSTLELHEALGTRDLSSYDYLAIDLMRDDVSVLPASCTLALVDTALEVAKVPMAAVAPIAEFIRTNDTNGDASPTLGDRVFESHTVPLSAFTAVNASWNASAVSTVRLACDDLPLLVVDNIRFGGW